MKKDYKQKQKKTNIFFLKLIYAFFKEQGDRNREIINFNFLQSRMN